MYFIYIKKTGLISSSDNHIFFQNDFFEAVSYLINFFLSECDLSTKSENEFEELYSFFKDKSIEDGCKAIVDEWEITDFIFVAKEVVTGYKVVLP